MLETVDIGDWKWRMMKKPLVDLTVGDQSLRLSTAHLKANPGQDQQAQAEISKPSLRSASPSPFPTTTPLTTTTLSTTTFPNGKPKPVLCFNRKPKEKREHIEERAQREESGERRAQRGKEKEEREKIVANEKKGKK